MLPCCRSPHAAPRTSAASPPTSSPAAPSRHSTSSPAISRHLDAARRSLELELNRLERSRRAVSASAAWWSSLSSACSWLIVSGPAAGAALLAGGWRACVPPGWGGWRGWEEALAPGPALWGGSNAALRLPALATVLGAAALPALLAHGLCSLAAARLRAAAAAALSLEAARRDCLAAVKRELPMAAALGLLLAWDPEGDHRARVEEPPELLAALAAERAAREALSALVDVVLAAGALGGASRSAQAGALPRAEIARESRAGPARESRAGSARESHAGIARESRAGPTIEPHWDDGDEDSPPTALLAAARGAAPLLAAVGAQLPPALAAWLAAATRAPGGDAAQGIDGWVLSRVIATPAPKRAQPTAQEVSVGGSGARRGEAVRVAAAGDALDGAASQQRGASTLARPAQPQEGDPLPASLPRELIDDFSAGGDAETEAQGGAEAQADAAGGVQLEQGEKAGDAEEEEALPGEEAPGGNSGDEDASTRGAPLSPPGGEQRTPPG